MAWKEGYELSVWGRIVCRKSCEIRVGAREAPRQLLQTSGAAVETSQMRNNFRLARDPGAIPIGVTNS
jgi:hypothetical protein